MSIRRPFYCLAAAFGLLSGGLGAGEPDRPGASSSFPAHGVIASYESVVLQAPETIEAPDGHDPLGALVLHAGGVVEFGLPTGWSVAEVPVAREMRAVLTPEPWAASRRMPDRGVWLTFHARSRRASRGDLESLLRERLTSLNLLSGEPEAIAAGSYAGYPSIEVELLEEAGGTVWTRHLLIETPWGLCEWQARAAGGTEAEISGAMQAMLATQQLRAPRAFIDPGSPHVAAARPLIGSWKSSRSRLRVYPNGSIAIVLDRPRRILGNRAVEAPAVIRGQFVAREDLLLVTWEDGSLLNFRWRLEGDTLLLTDHEGQISQLYRLFE